MLPADPRAPTTATRSGTALADGDIDFVVSDHSPCTAELKRRDAGDFAEAWGGIASLQLGLPAVWTDARERGHSLADVVRLDGHRARPAGSGCADKGEIAVGYGADLCVFAPDEAFTVDVAPRCTTRTPSRPTPGVRSPARSGRPGCTAHRSTWTPPPAGGC